jgi:hypothetical protein
MKQYLIMFAVVMVAVIAAHYVAAKLGLDTYEVYQ